jgi:hypothetical protein
MTERLRLRLEPDTDGTAELFVEVAHTPFAGTGSAWFSPREISEFGRRLQQTYPIPQGTSLVLAGGYWNSTQPPTLKQTHVGLSFYPLGGTGTIGVHVELHTPLQRDERPESQFSLSVELMTYYEPLRAFGANVVSLAEGKVPMAELECNVC